MPKTKPKPAEEPASQLPVEIQDYTETWWNPRSLMEAREMAAEYAASDLVPKEFKGKPGNVLVAWSLGAPLKLSVLSSLTSIAVINGKPSIYGDAAAAVVRAHPLCRQFVEPQVTGSGDDMEAICTIQRGSEEPVIRSFSVQDAKTAKLWGREGPWRTYPKRMLQMRARSWAMRDAFPDALCGMPIYEEVRDITDQVKVSTAEPEGATATERLKNRLKGATSTDEKASSEPATVPAEEKGPETPADAPEAASEPEKTIEDFIAEAKTSEDLTRLNEEIRHREEQGEIDKTRQMELVQLVHDRSQEIAKGSKKKGKEK